MTNAITGFACRRIERVREEPGAVLRLHRLHGAALPAAGPGRRHRAVPRPLPRGLGRGARRALPAGRRARASSTPSWALAPRAEDVIPWDATKGQDWQSARMEVYAAQVHVMDRGVGRILDALEQLGVLEETLVLFLGDNGASAEAILPTTHHGSPPPATGSRCGPATTRRSFPARATRSAATASPGGASSATPFRRYKLWVEEGGISTPCIASWPGTLAAGGIDPRPLHLMDVMPTFVDLADARYPASHHGSAVLPMEGESFADALSGSPEPGSRRVGPLAVLGVHRSPGGPPRQVQDRQRRGRRSLGAVRHGRRPDRVPRPGGPASRRGHRDGQRLAGLEGAGRRRDLERPDRLPPR